MAGNARFESPSASSSEPVFSGPYLNGKRATVGHNLDRSGSFREVAESQVFGSGFAVSRGGNSEIVASRNLPPLAQCLSLDPIPVGDRKVDRSIELRRVMGLFFGSTTEENSSGAVVAAHSKSSPPVAVAEDLKRLRSSVVDTCNTARGRASKLDEHLHKLDKYCDGVISKKPLKNELMNNDQAGALNSKTGTQMYKNSTELVNQRVEDRPKSVLLNKRLRTSVAETRQAEFRGSSQRRHPVTMAKDRDLIKDNVGESVILEEKIHRLPAVGEGWDKKMKRKRSVGTSFIRPIDSNGEPKRSVQNKVIIEPGLQSNDTNPYRLGSSNGTGSTHKLDNKMEVSSLSNGSRVRLSPRNELEGPTREIIAGSNKEKILTKGNNKLNSRDDSYTPCGNIVTKGKASRTPRNGAMVAAGSLPSTPLLSGTPENWENVAGGNKIPSTGGTVNRKRAFPSASSSPNMALWGGQRPQKMSRTRRSNLVSPVSNQEEKPLSSGSCSHSDVSVRLASNATNENGPLVSKQFKPKLEAGQSPHRVSESEESVGGHNGSQNVGPSLAIEIKVKSVINEESVNGGKKQGRSGRGPLIARASSSLTGEKFDNPTMVKPLKNNISGCEKNGSKLGRPLKKLSEHKGFSCLGNLQSNGSECAGKSDDDREELLAAANYARNSRYLACSSPFWKRMEPIFAPVSSKDKVYLSQQLKEQAIPESIPQLHGRENNVNISHEAFVYDTNSHVERNGHVKHQGSESFFGRLDSDKTSKELIPLFQRVLSALIIEDTIDELEEQDDNGNTPFEDSFCDPAYDTYDYDPRKRPRKEFEHDTMFGQSVRSVKVSFSSNGCTNTNPSINDSLCEDGNFINRPQVIQMDGFGISSFDNQYEQMRLDDKLLMELHSIGIYPELVSKLDDMEDKAIKHEIDQLKIKLRQQNYKKKACLEKICKGVGSSVVGRELEQVALDRLVEMSYRKFLFLATKGPSRGGIQKIPKHVALAFGRRTLARCRKFGKSGVSCFNVPPLRDILFAPLEHDTTSVGGPTATKYIGFQNPYPDSRISSDEAFAINGPISNSGKKKEVLLDDVVSGTMGKRSYLGNRKPKQATSGNGFNNQNSRSLHPVQPSSYGFNPNRMVQEMSKVSNEIVDGLHDLDPIGGPQDLSCLLNFDEEDLQDHFSAGLEIPMDDLTELNMF